jgi:hypothetical protein
MGEKDKATGSEHGPLFNDLRASILENTGGERQSKLLGRLNQLEMSVNSSSFGEHVKAFVEEAEEEAAAIAPFLSRLSSLLP